MNSNFCHRCRIKLAELSCRECKTSLCSQCDSFVHSSLKSFHKREKIKSFSLSEQNTNYETNFNFYNNSPSHFDKNEVNEDKYENICNNSNQLNLNNELEIMNKPKNQKKSINISRISNNKLLDTYNSPYNNKIEDNKNINRTYNLDSKYKKENFDENFNMGNIKDIKLSNITSKRNSIHNNYINKDKVPSISSKYIKQIREIYEQERKSLITKINKLTQELDNTKKNLSERIGYLHKHLYEIENKYKIDLREQNHNNLIEMKKSEEEKNIKIAKLQNIISDQNNIINESNLKIKNLEDIILNKENSLSKVNRKIKNMLEEKESLDNYYKNEIEQMKKRHNEEKESLISEYEHVINQISAELDINKKNYFNALKEIKEKENMIQNVVDNAANEKEQLSNDILKLKEQNNLEQNNLMEINSELKYESEYKSEEIEQLKNEIKNLTEENEMMKSKVNKMSKNNSGVKFTNSRINQMIKDTLFRK
jgi:hypothetical protein